VLSNEGRTREAAFVLLEALAADPSNVEAQFKLGNAYARMKDYPLAIDAWERARALSQDVAVHQSAASNLTKARDRLSRRESEARYAHATELTPAERKSAHEAYEAGVAAVGRREFGLAEKLFNVAIEIDPGLAEAFIARGSARIGLRTYELAAMDYDHAVGLAPQLAAPIYGLAEAYRALGRREKAREFYLHYAQSSLQDARPELQADARAKASRLEVSP